MKLSDVASHAPVVGGAEIEEKRFTKIRLRVARFGLRFHHP
jgi:hypothetical protein